MILMKMMILTDASRAWGAGLDTCEPRVETENRRDACEPREHTDGPWTALQRHA